MLNLVEFPHRVVGVGLVKWATDLIPLRYVVGGVMTLNLSEGINPNNPNTTVHSARPLEFDTLSTHRSSVLGTGQQNKSQGRPCMPYQKLMGSIPF